MKNVLGSLSVLTALVVSASCGDGRTSQSSPTGPMPSRSLISGGGSNAPVPGTCTTVNAIEAEINAVVPPGSNRGTVHGNFGKIQSDVNKKDIAGAQALAYATTKLLVQLYKAHQLTGTQAQAAKLINDLFCYSGLAITISDPANSSVISPTDPTQVVLNSTGTTGSSVPTGAVTEPTVLEFVPINDTFGGHGHGPLNTKLDQYGGFVAITASSTTGAPLAHPVVIGVCPPPGMDASVRARLRLGHQASTGFEITPPADASFLTCPTSVGEVRSRVPGWIRSLASLVLPKKAYARMQFFATGGVGGTAGEFSPFDPVDPVLNFTGGVGGTAGEFRRVPVDPAPIAPVGPVKPAPSNAPAFQMLSGTRLNTVVAGVCTDTAAVWGGVLERECSPAVSLTTHLGTKLTGVPVTWSIGAGGGTVALAATSPWTCGAFGSVANATTDANGESHICWTMGGTPGLHNNTVTATPHAGGDAPAGVTFVPASGTFTASALRRTPVATATGGTFNFDNLAHPGSGTCSDGLTPALSYDGGGSAPVNPGTYTLTVTCGDGNLFYNTVYVTAQIVIVANFSDGFEVESGWTATGLWNRSTLKNGDNNPIVNSLFPTYVDAAAGDASSGALPSPFAGSYAFWYGDPATGSYIGTQAAGDYSHSGGTSTAQHSGTLTSPAITLPPVTAGTSIVMRFNTWWDIESVNPSSFDVMQVSVQDVATSTVTPLGALNPSSDPAPHGASTPFTSGGFNAPPGWTEVVHDLSAFSGKTIRLIYSFDTRDVLYNGFRGWIIDNVRVGSEPTVSVSAIRIGSPRAIGGAAKQSVPTVTLQRVPSAAAIRRPRQ